VSDGILDSLIAVFVVNTLFAVWVVFRGGAEWLWRSLQDGSLGNWSPRTLRTLTASLWGVNAWALFVVLDA
jgi:hypothetical protein